MIPENIQKLFKFIEFLHSNIENFKGYEPIFVEIDNLKTQQSKFKPKINFKEKEKYDEIQKLIVEKAGLVRENVFEPTNNKAIELDIFDLNNLDTYTDIHNGFTAPIENLIQDFNDKDKDIIIEHKNKYYRFQEEVNNYYFESIFFRELETVLKRLFDFFEEPKKEPFAEHLENFSQNEIATDFENIVKQFLDKEIEQKPPCIFGMLKKPLEIGNSKYLIIPYIPLKIFKNELELRLKKEFVNRENVIDNFRNTYIQKSLEDRRYKSIYDNLKSGNETVIILQNPTDRFSHYEKLITVKELIKLEQYLNELEYSNTDAAKTTKQNEDTKINPHPNIFTNAGFQLWERLFTGFSINSRSRSDVKFIFEEMRKSTEGHIHNSVSQTIFLKWLNDTYELEVQKTSNHSRTQNRLNLYNSLK